MNELEKKLRLLAKIARVLNAHHILWAVGGSILLYFKGKTDTVHDLDLMVHEDDAAALKQLLLPMGTLAPPNPNRRYKTRQFLEFTIDGIDVDVMAGFVIVKDGKEYDCSLLPEQIAEYLPLYGERIPLQSLSDWRNYYTLMDRPAKVALIDG